MVIHTIKSLLKKGADILKKSAADTPILDSEILLAYALGCSREKLIIDWEEQIADSIVRRYLDFIKMRAAGKPVQYITGHQEFMGLDFFVGEGVLIPRPDTEITVLKVLELLKSSKGIPKIADLCTGSGAIGVSLSYYIEDSFIYAVDISKVALEYCENNAINNNVLDKMKILNGDLAKPLFVEGLAGELDVLVSNPPYISKREMAELPGSVRYYEPHLALFGGEIGLDFYEKILKDAPILLKKDGILIFEIGYNQGEAIKRMIEKTGCFTDIKIEKDLAGLDRCVFCYLKE
ncbi:MAG: peptide chain release factor N(5)-glutamine methyltransferase [Firmicutes bacterium]|nr:peptide chain release factor N(5)-glutamine methyltransferase [Bacillota bacterium]